MSFLRMVIEAATIYADTPNESLSSLSSWFVSYSAKLQPGDRIEFSSGENQRDVQFTVNFMVDRNDRGPWLRSKLGFEKALGSGHYFPARDGDGASVILEVYVEQSVMDRVILFAQAGKHPQSISLDIGHPALSLGWAPDGSDKRWDTSVNLVPITDVRFAMPLSDEPLTRDEPNVLELPATPVGADLLPALKVLADRQLWAIYAIAALGVILIWRH